MLRMTKLQLSTISKKALGSIVSFVAWHASAQLQQLTVSQLSSEWLAPARIRARGSYCAGFERAAFHPLGPSPRLEARARVTKFFPRLDQRHCEGANSRQGPRVTEEEIGEPIYRCDNGVGCGRSGLQREDQGHGHL
jgi:hypothetical protein